jgi:hypothetical protein
MNIRLTAATAGIILLFAGYQSVRFAWADLLRTSGDLTTVQESIRLIPIDSRPLLREASLIAAANPLGREDQPILERAVALNPHDAEAWMALALKAELLGNNDLAEKHLLHAASLDHTFKPAWTLANFYVRSGDMEKFWHWIRICIDLVEPRNAEALTFDPRPMFNLCWNVTDDANLILDRAIPRKHFVLSSYLKYLLDTERYDASLSTARLLFPMADHSDYDTLLYLCVRLIVAENVGGAVEAWNTLADRKLFGLAALHPSSGISLSNGDLRVAPLENAFDWRFIRPGGVYDTYSPAGPFIRLDFDGEEPEHCVVLAQVMPLLRGRRYRFAYSYETSGLVGSETGLRWYMPPSGLGAVAARDQSGEDSFEFVAPVDQDTPMLVLLYDRLPGTVKIKGSFKLLRATLRMLP